MIKKQLLFALRRLGRHKLTTSINVLGLTFGILSCVVIYLYVAYEFSYDKFHADGDRIYRLVTSTRAPGLQDENAEARIAAALAIGGVANDKPNEWVPALVASGVIALIVVAALARVLLLTSVSPDLARARGVNVRLVGIVYLAALAVSVSLAAVAIGAVLSTALLIGPAATALRVTKSPARAMAASALTGLAATWLGIVLAYDSYYWPPRGHGWPVSFFVVALVLMGYLISYVRPRRKRAPRSPHEDECGGPEMIAVSTGNTASTGGTATCSPA